MLALCLRKFGVTFFLTKPSSAAEIPFVQLKALVVT
jgi:Na+/serine symporter